MTPRMGRPPSKDPKDTTIKIRLSDGDQQRLDCVMTVTGFTKSDIIRQGIQMMYDHHCQEEPEKE